jgi:hypothetical protein
MFCLSCYCLIIRTKLEKRAEQVLPGGKEDWERERWGAVGRNVENNEYTCE